MKTTLKLPVQLTCITSIFLLSVSELCNDIDSPTLTNPVEPSNAFPLALHTPDTGFPCHYYEDISYKFTESEKCVNIYVLYANC